MAAGFLGEFVMNFHFAFNAVVMPLASAEVNLPEFLSRISGFLGGYYLVLAVMNAVMALVLWKQKRCHRGGAVVGVCGRCVCDSFATGGEREPEHDAAVAGRDSRNG